MSDLDEPGSEVEEEDTDWVTIARFDDPMQAEMTRDFLESHGVKLRTLGNAPQMSVLNRFTTVMDIRLAVAREDVAEAEEVLAALESANLEHPYRGSEDRAVAALKAEGATPRRYRRAAFVLGLIVPIGAGHFYAQHSAMAVVLLGGIVAGLLGAVVGGQPWMAMASLIVIACDVVLSPWAVMRHNAGAIPHEGRQRVMGVLIVVTAVVLALVLRGMS